MNSLLSLPSIAANMLDQDYRAGSIVDTPGFITIAAARKHFKFSGGTRINNDGWSLSFLFHAGRSNPQIRAPKGILVTHLSRKGRDH